MVKTRVETEVTEEKSSFTSAVVQDSRGQTIRVYDEATHGKKFEELARMFVSHNPGTSVLKIENSV